MDYVLTENGPEDVKMNDATDVRWMECVIPTLPNDVNITRKLMTCIEHNYDKKRIERAEQPFAEGGQRLCYHGKLISTDRRNNSISTETIVMKRFKKFLNRDSKQEYIDLMETQFTAAYLATEFNKVSPAGSKEIQFLKVRGKCLVFDKNFQLQEIEHDL